MDPHLTDIIRKKQTDSPLAQEIDWDDRRARYVSAVDDLYNQVAKILAQPLAAAAVKIERRPKQLTEDYIGTYAVDDLILRIGQEQVRFSPVGRNVAGTSGRVDVIGDQGEASLIVQPGPRWSYVRSRRPTLRAVPFDEAVLAEVLETVMRD